MLPFSPNATDATSLTLRLESTSSPVSSCPFYYHPNSHSGARAPPEVYPSMVELLWNRIRSSKQDQISVSFGSCSWSELHFQRSFDEAATTTSAEHTILGLACPLSALSSLIPINFSQLFWVAFANWPSQDAYRAPTWQRSMEARLCVRPRAVVDQTWVCRGQTCIVACHANQFSKANKYIESNLTCQKQENNDRVHKISWKANPSKSTRFVQTCPPHTRHQEKTMGHWCPWFHAPAFQVGTGRDPARNKQVHVARL